MKSKIYVPPTWINVTRFDKVRIACYTYQPSGSGVSVCKVTTEMWGYKGNVRISSNIFLSLFNNATVYMFSLVTFNGIYDVLRMREVSRIDPWTVIGVCRSQTYRTPAFWMQDLRQTKMKWLVQVRSENSCINL